MTWHPLSTPRHPLADADEHPQPREGDDVVARRAGGAWPALCGKWTDGRLLSAWLETFAFPEDEFPAKGTPTGVEYLIVRETITFTDVRRWFYAESDAAADRSRDRVKSRRMELAAEPQELRMLGAGKLLWLIEERGIVKLSDLRLEACRKAETKPDTRKRFARLFNDPGALLAEDLQRSGKGEPPRTFYAWPRADG